jgi:hypothetical protein
MLLYFLIYSVFGMLWFGIIHNRISITNMLQPAFLIITWPLHVIIFLFLKIWD